MDLHSSVCRQAHVRVWNAQTLVTYAVVGADVFQHPLCCLALVPDVSSGVRFVLMTQHFGYRVKHD